VETTRGYVAREDVLRTLLVKGYATPDALAACLFCTVEQTADLLDRLVADGLAEISAGAFRLSADGKAAASELIAMDRDRWGAEAASAALDAFLALDGRMKETVTAWQMRDVDGSPAFNDHADLDYDRGVLERLAALHADATAWLRPLTARLDRLATYDARLQRAAACALDGDAAYVASPRVDSYHSVWFELHEDLILLAGRTRADEVAAGRA
jgi:pyruvate,orthophosphate dikinase